MFCWYIFLNCACAPIKQVDVLADVFAFSNLFSFNLLELVSLHSTSMSIIGSMVYFGHPVLLCTSGISYRILPERTVRWLGIKCRVVNKSFAEATLTKYHHRDVHH